ncbi:MAG: arginine--tRNA ligase [Acidobacteria bacterium]|nr:arginine--tRNA ligase [Acidobacteriota bacterium]
MPSSFIQTLKSLILDRVHTLFDLKLEDVAVEIPPRPNFGDLAFPVGFELAKRLRESTGQKQNPRALAEQLRTVLGHPPGISKVEVAGPGYLNFFLDRADFLLTPLPLATPSATDEKAIVEHTSINPNKAAHLGHLRNAVLGDTLVRLLRASGARVEVHNYIDNTGVQVADVVFGFYWLEKKSKTEVQNLPGRFDYYCWDLYTRVGDYFRQNPEERLRRSVSVLREIEERYRPSVTGLVNPLDNEITGIAEVVVNRIIDCHLKTMARLGIRYDLLPRESEILSGRFWERAKELLQEKHGLVVRETEGRNQGCLVMRAESEPRDAPAKADKTSDSDEEYDQDKILERSDGTVTYTGKDIAYHLWKLGKLGKDFCYAQLTKDPDGQQTWITSSIQPPPGSPSPPSFGGGAYYLSVIGSEQSYLQKFVKQALVELTHDPSDARIAHIAYEKVALTPAAIAELGIELSEEEAGRQRIGMSGRRGLGIKADDLIDRLEACAFEEVATRHPELDDARQRLIAHQIGVAALRYFLLKFSRTTVIVFDFKEALSFDGETGPYLQYSVVRANSVLEKLAASGLEQLELASLPSEQIASLLTGDDGDELWGLIYLGARLDLAIEEASANLEPAILAKFTYQLAQRFNLFYHHYRILSEPDIARRTLLIGILKTAGNGLARALEIMGIEVPECM